MNTTSSMTIRSEAFDAGQPIPKNLDKESLLEATSGHILAEAELIGTYERKK